MQRVFITLAFCGSQFIGAFLNPVTEQEGHLYLSTDCLNVCDDRLYGHNIEDPFSVPIVFEGNPSVRFCDDQNCEYPVILSFRNSIVMIPQKTIKNIFQNGNAEVTEFANNFISKIKLYPRGKLEIYQLVVSLKTDENDLPFIEIKLIRLNNSFFERLKFSYQQMKTIFSSFYNRFTL